MRKVQVRQLAENFNMQTLVIERGRAESNYWRDLFNYRELFLILAWRDVAVRYKQTVAGAAWAIIQPLLQTLVLTVIFGKIAGMHSNGPYAVMVCAASLPWNFFANALTLSSQSVVNNSNLISKIYFPRLIVPTSSVVVSFVDFLVAGSILAGLMAWYHVWPTWRLLALPFLVLMAIGTALGPGFISTALTVRFRDFRMIVPFIVQFGLYACGVPYDSSEMHKKLGEKLYFIYSLNPMVSVVNGFRWAVLGGETAAQPQATATGIGNAAMATDTSVFCWPAFALSIVIMLTLLVIGIKYFRKTERAFADII
jgi:lipopolysaccharide transport system permease protein